MSVRELARSFDRTRVTVIESPQGLLNQKTQEMRNLMTELINSEVYQSILANNELEPLINLNNNVARAANNHFHQADGFDNVIYALGGPDFIGPLPFLKKEGGRVITIGINSVTVPENIILPTDADSTDSSPNRQDWNKLVTSLFHQRQKFGTYGNQTEVDPGGHETLAFAVSLVLAGVKPENLTITDELAIMEGDNFATISRLSIQLGEQMITWDSISGIEFSNSLNSFSENILNVFLAQDTQSTQNCIALSKGSMALGILSISKWLPVGMPVVFDTDVEYLAAILIPIEEGVRLGDIDPETFPDEFTLPWWGYAENQSNIFFAIIGRALRR